MEKGPVKAKELLELVVGADIKIREKNPMHTNDNTIAHLKMMINHPEGYVHTKKINQKTLGNFLKYAENKVFWIMNFYEIKTRYQKMIA